MALLSRTCILLLLALSPASALLTSSQHVQFELISANEAISPGTSFWVAAHFKIDPGWHLYWKVAGESGLPTTLQWQLPEGFKAGETRWESPDLFDFEGIASYGYKNEFALLTQLTAPQTLQAGTTVTLTAQATWLACETACIPGMAERSLKLPVATSPVINTITAERIEAVNKRVPQPLPETWEARAYHDEGKITLTLTPKALLSPKIDAFAYFFDENQTLDTEAKQLLFPLENGGILLKLTPKENTRSTLKGILKGNFAPIETGIALDLPIASMPPAKTEGPAVVKSHFSEYSLLRIIGLAFIGGMILNLMPCVFPVLGIKVLSFVKKAGSDKWKIRAHGLLFTLGVLIAFWILTLILLSMKAAGEEIGWGFQLQYPPFVAALSLLLWLMALNFAGIYEMGVHLMSAGQSLASKNNFSGSFFSGMLATVVATPCTAPFMGTAIGFAITQPVSATLGIFTSMGLGMATPYLVLSLIPALIHYLPKPGAWMETFKNLLSFPLFASVIWLLWVFGRQTDVDALSELLAALLIAGMAVWVFGRWVVPHKRIGVQRKAIACTSLLLVSAILVAYQAATPDTIEGDLIWEPYSQARFEALRADKRIIFIDFTAAWCLTCQVNKRTSLKDPEVVARFKKLNVALLLADWTEHNTEITLALERYGRNGVPVYVLYSENPQTAPVILPEILTPTIVLDALEAAYLKP